MRFLFGPSITSAIRDDLDMGGKFSRLKIEIPALKCFSFIQYQRQTPTGEYFGLGVARSLELAKIKAFFEFLERKAFLEADPGLNLRSSNGVAAHKFKILARKSAAQELFERDAFLTHWYLQVPFASPQVDLPINLGYVVDDLKQIGHNLRFWQTTLGYGPTTLAIIENQRTGGFCAGTCLGTRPKSFEKAAIEAVISLLFGDHGKAQGDLLRDLSVDGFTTLQAHRTYWLYAQRAPDWLQPGAKGGAPRLLSVKRSPKVAYQTLVQRPFPVVAAKSDDLIDLALGHPTQEACDILTARYGPGIRIFSELPHPLF